MNASRGMKKRYIKIVIKCNELEIYFKATYWYKAVWKNFDTRTELLKYLDDYLKGVE